MTLQFSLVCALLEELHKQSVNGKLARTRETIRRWFAHHHQIIDNLDENHGAALLSTLLPARRTDRVYCIQAPRLEKIISRAQRLGLSRIKDLTRYKVPGSGVDLADCVQAILKATPNPVHRVTLYEVDCLLHTVASGIAFSSPDIRAPVPQLSESHRHGLEMMYMRLTPLEAKWFTRLVLKDYRPIEMDEALILRSYHSFLPSVMKVMDHFTPAVQALHKLTKAQAHGRPTEPSWKMQALRHLKPVLGTKVGRPPWRKARSIKHCLDMGRGGRMSVEKKVDGEYCQVHIDLRKGHKSIQIFSKSGKDSTEDRTGLHGVIRDSLDLGKASCKLSKGCILEGELLVYSDHEQKVLPFHKIRNHVTRRGRYMNNEMDSPPRASEHLMIVYYDAFLIDDESLVGVRHSERFERLKRLVTIRDGYAELVERHVVDFNRPRAASDLRNLFAKAITAREEGLVIKPDEPFIDLDRGGSSGSPIKFKKEYIGKFGDIGDFAVVGARYCPDKAKSYRIPNLQWTHFYLGCLTSKVDLYAADGVPEFTLVAVVNLNETMLRTVITHSQPNPVPFKDNRRFKLNIPPGLGEGKRPSVIFTHPLIFDVRCFSFDKEGNMGFYSPRFPTVSKVHFDRDYRDTITFADLQDMAEKATTEKPWEDRDSQEFLQWIAALEGADPKGIPVDRVTQQTATTAPTPSPRPFKCFSQRLPALLPSSSPCSGRVTLSQSSVGSSRLTLTPPTSSIAPETPAARRLATAAPGSSPQSEKRKASNEPQDDIYGSSPPRKRTNRLFEPEIQVVPSHPRPPDLSSSSNRGHREPLAEVTNNASQRSDSADALPSPCPRRTTTHLEIHPTEPLRLSAPSSLASPAVAHEHSGIKNIDPAIQEAKSCSSAGQNCPFYRRMVLVDPFLFNGSDKMKGLLARHGIYEYATDHSAWLPEDASRPKGRRVCFVDSQRRRETEEFLDRIEARPLLLGNGGREYIETYDWRLLEAVAEMEAKKTTKVGGANPWKRWFVGLV